MREFVMNFLRDRQNSIVWSIFCHNQSSIDAFCLALLMQAHTLSNNMHCGADMFLRLCVWSYLYYLGVLIVQNNLNVISQLVQLKLPRVNFAVRCVADRLYPSGDAAQIVMSWPVRVTLDRWNRINRSHGTLSSYISPRHILHNVHYLNLLYSYFLRNDIS